MPAVHVVGEIVGASGLRPRDALSVAHWLDLLSLHPSSRRSFFCRWRLGVRGVDKSTASSEDDEIVSSPWRVLQGATRGQTQVHSYSAITPLDEAVTKSSVRRRRHPQSHEPEPAEACADLVELETLWCHPIDLHIAVSEVSPLPLSWPFLEFQVWSLDEFHRERLVGEASTPLPLAQHEFFVDLPLTKKSRLSARETLTDWLDLRQESLHDDDHHDDREDDDDNIVTTSVGTMYVHLAIMQQGFLERGVFS